MTGYGKSVAVYNGKKINVEIKSLNSKSLDLSTRIAPLYREKEMEIRQTIQQRVLRGKVDFAIWIEKDAASDATVINAALAENYCQQIKAIAQRCNIPEPEDWFLTLMRMPDVTAKTEVETLDDKEWSVARAAVDEAIDKLVAFRTQEGAALEKKFGEKVDNIEQLLLSIEPYEKARVEKLSRALTHGLEKPKADAGDTPDATVMSAMKAACEDYLAAFDDFDASRKAADALVACAQASMGKLTNSAQEVCDEVLKFKDQLAKKTFWMFGGDGWAYDIGFGGLDHVVASGANVNVLVVDTEVYSNTGGQSSKATPAGAVAQFAASGKKTGKKDLGAILMSYGNVYVAQVAMGANYNQLVKALKEAEEYEGPSVIIAYAPCTSHGLKCGMHDVQGEMKRAVESGYWSLYHYDPRKENPMTLDSKEPTMDYLDFVAGENRFASLTKSFPKEAERLFEQGKEDAQRRFDHYRRMAQEQ